MSLAALEVAPTGPPDLLHVRNTLNLNRSAMVGYFSPERADVLRALDACALSRHHAFLGGKAGIAKSLIIETWVSQFVQGGAVYRRQLLTKQSTESDVLTYLDLPELMQGRSVYRSDGKLTEAHFAFGDECFEATGALLNAFLTFINERIVLGGRHVPLVSFFGASNKWPEDDSTAALEDRLLVRVWVERLSPGARLAFLRGKAQRLTPPKLAPITMAELEAAQEAVAAMPVDDSVLVALSHLCDSLQTVGVYVSDRKIGWCVEILKAVAWLDGATSVEPDDLDFLRHVLWRRPEDREAVAAALATVDLGVISEVRRIIDGALDVYKEKKALPPQAWKREALGTLQVIADAAKEIQDRFRDKVPDRTAGKIRTFLQELAAAHKDASEAARDI